MREQEEWGGKKNGIEVQTKNHTLVSTKCTMGKKKAPNTQWGKRKRQTHNGGKRKRQTHNGGKRKHKMHNGEKESAKCTIRKKKVQNAQ